MPAIRRRLASWTAFLALLAALPGARADTLWLANGDRLSGTVLSMDEGALAMQTDYAGTVHVAWDAVRTLETDGRVAVRPAPAADEIQARFVRGGEGQALLDTGQGEQPVELADVQRVVRPRPFLRDLSWDGTLDAGLQHKSASTDTRDYSLALLARARHGMWRHDLQAGYDKEKEEGSTLTDNYHARYSLDRFVTEQAFVKGRLYYRHDNIEDLRAQSAVGAGPGYQFWDDELGAFSLALLASRVHYRYRGGDSDAGYALGAIWDYGRYIGGQRLQVYTRGEASRPLDGVADLWLNAEAGLRYQFTDRLSFYLKYSRNLVDGAREDVDEAVYGTGLGISW